jgi:small subunit ribosomal protein S7
MAQKNEELMYDHFKDLFIKIMMKHGKKSTAESIFEEALMELRTQLLNEEEVLNPKEIFMDILLKSGPIAIVKSKRRGRQSVQVPIILNTERRVAIASKWIIEGARARNDRSMGLRLAKELLALRQGQGKANKNQTLMHKQAFANRFNANL